MTNGRIDEAQIDLMLADLPKESAEWKRARYTLTATAETRGDINTLRVQVASIQQHCRYCNDNDRGDGSDQEHVNWLIRIVTAKLFLPLAVTAGNVLITLALTGQL